MEINPTKTLAPTWAEALPYLIHRAGVGDSTAIADLQRMARQADQYGVLSEAVQAAEPALED